MKERPIIFSAPMVRAILAGTKTQTRRVVKPQPPEILPAYAPKVYWPARDRHMTHGDPDGAAYLQFERPGDYDGVHVMRGGFGFRCPYGQPGDRLWVRETWAWSGDGAIPAFDRVRKGEVWFRADPERTSPGIRWRPSIHMPRWASRITLEVTGVRVERLQDISKAEAVAEGIERGEGFPGWYRGPLPGDSPGLVESGRKFKTPTAFPRLAYRALWESINGSNSWDANPWVWVIEFKRVTP
jgi:hypothetical protein